jgi:hypothetical protein
MADDPTCGEGLAEHSVLPAKLAELTASLAENLEVHMRALDRTDENAEPEYGVYLKLVQEHRKIAALLEATAEKMAASRDLPMGRHDAKAMSSPAVVEAFERFVEVERDLAGLLEERVREDAKLLAEMGGYRRVGGPATADPDVRSR